MFCKKCGEKIPIGGRMCNNCGTMVSSTAVTTNTLSKNQSSSTNSQTRPESHEEMIRRLRLATTPEIARYISVVFECRYQNSEHSDRLNHAIENYIDDFERFYTQNNSRMYETMMYVASSYFWGVEYNGIKYPSASVDQIIRAKFGDIRKCDCTGLYEDEYYI